MKFNAILCGCGAMSKGWLRAIASTPVLAQSIQVVGLVDLNRATAENLAKEFSLDNAVIGSDLAEVIAATKADLVFDVVIPAARFGVVSTALKAGCHVLSEKPMATSLAEGAALIELAEQAGKVHAIIQNRRFISGVRRLRRFVEEGAIGELTGIHCDFFLGPHFGGFREEMDNVLLLDMAIHTFDAARYLAVAAPKAVYCLETNPTNSWYAQGASAQALFEFDGNIVVTYRGSWCAEGLRTSWESSWRLIGESGSLTWDGAEGFAAERVTATGEFYSTVEAVDIPELSLDDAAYGHRGVLRDFVAAVRAGSEPETVSHDNIHSLAMVLAAIESAESRRRVEISV